MSIEKETYWYAFQKESELRGALLQCRADVLLSSYHLWRFERTGDGKRFLLLSLEGAMLPAGWGHLLTFKSSRELPNVPLNPSDSTKKNPFEAKQRVVFVEQGGKSWTGWSFPLRNGEHLLAVLGLETISPNIPVAWVLFSLPVTLIREALSDHLTLNNYDLRCSSPENGRQWLWVRKPELYLVLKFKEMEDVELYHSFSTEKAFFTPWGYHSPLGERLQLPRDKSLIVLDLKGGSTHLNTTSWWMANEMITIEDLPAVQEIAPDEEELSIPIHLRYQLAEQRETPRLWLLNGSNALASIEVLFFELASEERAAVGLFVGEDPEGTGSIFILRDDRPYQETPLFSLGRACGFEPFFPEEGLYIKSGYRIYPNLPSEVWRKEFKLDVNYYTLLEPNTDRTSAQILKIPLKHFAPLEGFVHYRIGAQSSEVRAMSKSSTFEILFSPEAIKPDFMVPTSSDEKFPKNALSSGKYETASSLVSPVSSQKDLTSQGHLEHGRHNNPRLKMMEDRIRQSVKTGKPLTPQDWVSLASVYHKEYMKNKELSWLHETFKSLDQVLYLDRHANGAVTLEMTILNELLETEKLAFLERMQHLDQIIEQRDNNSFFARLAFRMRSRLLLNNQDNEEEALHLRLHFYRDLATLEDHLMIREHYIYVAGVAQYLEDDELLERAKLRYRQLLEDKNRLQRELPSILVN